MKKIILLFLVALLLCGCGPKKEENLAIPAASDPTQAQNQTQTQTQTQTGEDEIPEGEEAIGGATNNGSYVNRLIRVSQSDESGAEIWFHEYVYDDAGNRIEEMEYDGEGVLTLHKVNIFDENNFLVQTDFYREEYLNYSVFYRRDDAGRVLYQETREDETVVDSNEYTYDDQGNMLLNKATFDEEVLEYTFAYTYDDDFNITCRREYLNGEQISYEEMTYDSQGRQIASSYYQGDGTLSSATESTWEGTTETCTHKDGAGQVYMVSVITYDAEGNVLMQENQQDGQILSLVEYVYDTVELSN